MAIVEARLPFGIEAPLRAEADAFVGAIKSDASITKRILPVGHTKTFISLPPDFIGALHMQVRPDGSGLYRCDMIRKLRTNHGLVLQPYPGHEVVLPNDRNYQLVSIRFPEEPVIVHTVYYHEKNLL